MYEPQHYSSDSQEEEEDEEDITDYEGYTYEDDDEEGEGEEEDYYEESDQTVYTDEEYEEERDYSDEEPEIVCTTSTSSLDVKLSQRSHQDVWSRVRRKAWDLMVVIIAFCVAVMLGLYSMI